MMGLALLRRRVDRGDGPIAGPNLFIVGAMKAGTTTAYKFLEGYAEVYLSPVKEPHFFSADEHRHPHALLATTLHRHPTRPWITSLDKYMRLFGTTSAAEARYRAEASTDYLYSAAAPEKIADFAPNAKIVIFLRDPVGRAWSEYVMNVAIGIEGLSLARALEQEQRALKAGPGLLFKRYIRAGQYSEQLSRYLSRFPRENIHIDVIDRPGEDMTHVLARLASFLELEWRGGVSPRENVAMSPRWPKLNRFLYYSGAKALLGALPLNRRRDGVGNVYYGGAVPRLSTSDRELLEGHFRDEPARVQELIGIDVSHWVGGGPREGASESD